MTKLFRFATIVSLACALTARVVSGASDATTFRGNVQHTGVYDAPGVPELHGVRWKFKTGGRVYSSPAVAGGVVFVGSTDGHLYAIDAATGAERWKFATQGRVVSSPAVQAGVVYFASYDSNFYALDAASGALKWKFATKGEKRFAAAHIHGLQPASERMPDPFDFYLSSPAVANGIVYFGSGDGNVYALDAAAGTVKWTFQTGDVVHASPALAEGLLFIGSWDTYFYALDAATGAEKWRFKTGDDAVIHNQTGIQSSAAVANGVVYFGCRDAKLYALDILTGAKKWAADNKGSWVIGSPAVKDGKVYYSTSDGGLFHGVDARTGAELFALRFQWPMFSSPAVAGNIAYLRVARRQASRDRRRRAQIGLDVSDRCVARERPRAHERQRSTELRGGHGVVVLRRYRGRDSEDVQRRRDPVVAGDRRRHALRRQRRRLSVRDFVTVGS